MAVKAGAAHSRFPRARKKTALPALEDALIDDANARLEAGASVADVAQLFRDRGVVDGDARRWAMRLDKRYQNLRRAGATPVRHRSAADMPPTTAALRRQMPVNPMRSRRRSKQSSDVFPAEPREAAIDGVLSVVADGELLTSPFTAIRAVAFRWELFREEVDARGDTVEVFIEAFERRSSFALVDRHQRRATCAPTVPAVIELAPVASAVPVDRALPPEMQHVAARASVLVYREAFLLPDTDVRFVGVVGPVAVVTSTGYRDGAALSLAVVSASEIVELALPNPGPWYSRAVSFVYALFTYVLAVGAWRRRSRLRDETPL